MGNFPLRIKSLPQACKIRQHILMIFEALKLGLISNYLLTPPHMAGDTEGSPDGLGLKGNPLQDKVTVQSSELLNSV